MEYKDVQEFFKSWGVYPADELDDCIADDLNPEVICDFGINRKCYEKLCQEANDLHGANFSAFCSRQIDATDDAFYLSAATWAELEEAWYSYLDPARHSNS
jgi:hypothetical protein